MGLEAGMKFSVVKGILGCFSFILSSLSAPKLIKNREKTSFLFFLVILEF